MPCRCSRTCRWAKNINWCSSQAAEVHSKINNFAPKIFLPLLFGRTHAHPHTHISLSLHLPAQEHSLSLSLSVTNTYTRAHTQTFQRGNSDVANVTLEFQVSRCLFRSPIKRFRDIQQPHPLSQFTPLSLSTLYQEQPHIPTTCPHPPLPPEILSVKDFSGNVYD